MLLFRILLGDGVQRQQTLPTLRGGTRQLLGRRSGFNIGAGLADLLIDLWCVDAGEKIAFAHMGAYVLVPGMHIARDAGKKLRVIECLQRSRQDERLPFAAGGR